MENKDFKKIGFTIGKFAPLHKGHQFLIETALNEMDEFFIVLYETDVLDIDTYTRAKWIKKLYPQIEIILAKNPPMQYGLDKESVNIQMQYLSEIIKDKQPTHFYSSEPYGKYVAQYKNIIDRQVDKERKIVPINGTVIRKDIEKNKYWIENIVYNDLKKIR